MGKSITFKCKITNVAYFSQDSSWGAIDVQSTENIPHSREVYDYDIDSNKTTKLYSIRVVGKMAEPYVGAIVDVTGVHSFNQKYKSEQYTIEKIEYPQPSNPKENSAYLKSLVTERQAESLLNAYPNIVEEIIKGDDNVDFTLLPGIGQATYDKIRDKIVSNFAISDVLSLLTPLGVSFSKIQRMLDNEKNPKILREKIIRNPYFLVNFPGISFKTADKIAVQLNPSMRMSEERLAAFVKFYFTDIGENSGHTYTTINELRSGVIENIAECDKFFDEWIQKETNKEKLVHIEDDKIGLKYYYDSEKFIWNKIVELDKTVPLIITDENITEGIRIAEEELGFSLTEEQKNVVINMTKNNFCLSTGKSGTGKTTTARALLNIYKHAGYSVIVAAFSAKASRRATQATGFNGMTLHKLLGIGKDGKKVEEESTGAIPFDILFVDENSMNPLFLMRKIFELVGKAPIKIVLCGDNKQINPIGVGNIFSDLLEKDCFNKNVLTKIQRQAADSGIIVDGNLIRESIDPIDVKEPRVIHGVKKDLIYVFKNDKEEIFRLAVSSYLKSVKDKGIGNVILLVPF
ncbi:MAG: AAA family ATPase, partial [Thermoplasmata archaeon]|nr:AAA family ATPase [Thermoplasmata archaeon]